MKPYIEELRKKYMDNPPEGMTSENIRHMSGDDLFGDGFSEDGFYIFWTQYRLIVMHCQKFI